MATGKISKRAVDSIEPASKVQFLWGNDLKGLMSVVEDLY